MTSDSDSDSVNPAPWQFGLRALFALTAYVSIVLAFVPLFGAMLVLLASGLLCSVIGAVVAFRRYRTLNATVYSGSAGWFGGNFAFFMATFLYMVTFEPAEAHRDFGPALLLTVGVLCYGVPSLILGAIAGSVTWTVLTRRKGEI